MSDWSSAWNYWFYSYFYLTLSSRGYYHSLSDGYLYLGFHIMRAQNLVLNLHDYIDFLYLSLGFHVLRANSQLKGRSTWYVGLMRFFSVMVTFYLLLLIKFWAILQSKVFELLQLQTLTQSLTNYMQVGLIVKVWSWYIVVSLLSWA